MTKPLQYDQNTTMQLMNKLEGVIIEMQPTYADVMVACLALATISANNMHMAEEVFLANCQLVFAQDKIEKMKEMQ